MVVSISASRMNDICCCAWAACGNQPRKKTNNRSEMRFDKDEPPASQHVTHPKSRKQRNPLLILGSCVLLAACGSAERVVEDTFTGSGNFAGMAAADEPQAVLVGRDVITSGGNAVDAAVSMAFMMTLTLPSQVGFGSSGTCLVYDHGQKMVDAVTFVPRPSGPENGDQSLVPALPRGLFLMHAKYGRVRWDQLLAPAQSWAQRGVPASRAFMRQFTPFADTVLADPVARTVFQRADGQPIGEGDLIRNPGLATAIGRMALHGVGEFY